MRIAAILMFNFSQLIKNPLLLFNYIYFSKKIIYLSESFNNKLIFFITKYIGLNNKEVKKSYYSSGTIKVFTNNYFYKIGFFSTNINIEFKNYCLIKKKYTLLSDVLPEIIFSHYFLLNFMKIKKYELVPYAESIKFGVEFLKLLRKYGEEKTFNISKYKNINRAISLCGILYGNTFEKKLKFCVENILSVPWMVGPVHGDFNLENMVFKKDEKPLIIDLENFTEEGLQALDAFNFLIDVKKKKSDQQWQDIVKELISSNLINELDRSFIDFLDHDLNQVAILYILNKLGYDNDYYDFLSKSIQSEFYFIKKLIY